MYFKDLVHRKPGSADLKEYLRFSGKGNLSYPRKIERRDKTPVERCQEYHDGYF
jgi:hypothetical protein